MFRFSAAQVRWNQAELDQLQSLWARAYKRAESLANGTASDVFIFPQKWGGEELSTPINIMSQELCNNIRRCLVHDDVTKSITVQELQQAKDEWMCHTLHELYDEMELWNWNEVQHNRWARTLKASHRVGVRPIWFVEELEQEGQRLSWATATRSLRRLKARIVRVGGKRDQPKELAWKLEDAALGTPISRGGSVLEDSWGYSNSRIRFDLQPNTGCRWYTESSAVTHSGRRPREQRHKAPSTVDTQGDHRNLRKRSRNSPSVDRAGRLDRTRGTAQVSSAKKVEVEHGPNEPDAPMADEERTSTWNQGSRNCTTVR